MVILAEWNSRSGCGGARTRTEACFEHATVEKDEVRYRAGVNIVELRDSSESFCLSFNWHKVVHY